MKISNLGAVIPIFALHMLLLYFNRDEFFGLGHAFLLYTAAFILLLPTALKNIAKNGLSFQQKVCLFIILYSTAVYLVIGGQRDILFATYLFMGLYFTFSAVDFSRKQKKTVLAAYYLSSVILSLLILVQRRSPYRGEIRYSVFFSEDGYYDVNFLSTYISLPTALMFHEVFSKRGKNAILLSAGFLINLFAVFLTGSRGGLFALLLLVGFDFLASKKIHLRHKIVLILVMLFASVVALSVLPDSTAEHISRGIDLGENSRRVLDWKIGLDLFQLHPLFGNGLHSPLSLVIENYGIDYLTAHNTYISYLVFFGLAGGIPMIMLLLYPVAAYFTAYKAKHLDLFYAVAYCCFLLQIWMIEGGFSDILLIPLLIFGMNNWFIQDKEKSSIRGAKSLECRHLIIGV